MHACGRRRRPFRHYRDADPEALADAALRELLPTEGATDDTALIAVRL
ncbi:hypothetical protein ABZ864_21480 [Streptomyces sp. NPDC047082]